MERSLYIVKPEATGHRERIRKIVAAAGLTIVKDSRHNVTGAMLSTIYPDEPIGIAAAARSHLLKQRCEFVIVEGPNGEVEEALRRVIGREADPAACAPGTIRRRYGIIAPVSTMDGPYFKNAVHYPGSREEADALLALL